MAPEAAEDVAVATLEMALEAEDDVAVSVSRRPSLATGPVREASSSLAITVEFAVLSLIRPITYFANYGLNLEAFDVSEDFCG